MPKYVEGPDGQVIEFPAGMTDESIAKVLRKQYGEPQAAPAAPQGALAAPQRAEMDPRELMAQGITRSGFGTGVALSPEQRVAHAARVIRTAPGLIPNPMLAGAASAGTETIAQAAEQGVGSRQEFSPVEIGIAAAVPPVMAGAGRLVRGAGRTLTRILPSRFRAAHEGALEAAGQMADELRPSVSPRGLFQSARAAGSEAIPATRTMAMLDDLGKAIPKNPASPALKIVREHMDNIGQAVQGGALSLDDLMALRRDLGASLGKAPEMKAMYKGLIQDLEGAAAAGGPGAQAAKEALTAFKRDLGVNRLTEIVESSTSSRAIPGGDLKILNIAKLTKLFSKDAKQFADLLGPEGVQTVGAFIQRFRSLPPEVAWNGWNMMVGALFGGAGFIGGGALPAVGAALGQELARNAAAVGKNPAALNQFMTTLVQAARAAVVTPAPQDGGREPPRTP